MNVSDEARVWGQRQGAVRHGERRAGQDERGVSEGYVGCLGLVGGGGGVGGVGHGGRSRAWMSPEQSVSPR